MVVQEWLDQKYDNSRFIDGLHIERIFLFKDLPSEKKKELNLPNIQMTTKEEITLWGYVFVGKLRQMLVANAVRMQILKSGKLRRVWERCYIKSEVEDNMYYEPYVVFYKNHILKAPTRLSRIEDRVEEVKQLCITKPSHYEFQLHAEGLSTLR